MRIASFTLSVPLAIAAVGCSDVECSMSEIKVADECYPRRAGDAGVIAAADGSTTESASVVDAGAERDAGRDAGHSPTPEEGPAVRPDAAAAEGVRDAAVAEAAAPSSPAQDPRDAETPRVEADAGSPPPVADAGGTCFRAPEVCDGVDNDCNGQIDDAAGTAWYRDCDGDGFALNAVGKVEGCKKPAPASGCAGWTQRDPANPAEQDCDDVSAQRFPGADFGFATRTTGDLNCDGVLESVLEFVENAPESDLGPGGDHEPGRMLALCKTRHVCGCYDTEAAIIGYRGFDTRGMVIAESAAPWYMRFSDTPNPPPCARAQDEVIGLSYVHPGPTRLECTQNSKAIVIARQLCR